MTTIIVREATSYQYGQVLKEMNVEYQFISRSLHYSNRKKKQTGLIDSYFSF